MATDAEKKVLPGDGDVGAPDDEARKDSKVHVYHVMKSTAGVFKKFLAPEDKYKESLAALGVEKFDPTKADHKKAIVTSKLYAGRIRVTVKDDTTTASLTLLCAPDKLGTAPEALIGKKVYSYVVQGAAIPRKQILQ